MDNIQSNSQESLFKDKISNICPEVTYRDIYSYLDKLISDNNLDSEKLYTRLLEAVNKTPDIRSPYYFVTRVASSIVRNEADTVKANHKVVAIQALYNALRKVGVESGKDEYQLLLNLVEQHCVDEFPVSVEELTETNNAIVKYCEENKVKTYKQVVELFLRSKFAKKCNVPVKELHEKAYNINRAYLRTI